MLLSTLLSGFAVHWLSGVPECEVSSIVYDSRNCVPDCVFVAVRGTDADGHVYIADAVRRGAIAVVCERPVELGSGVAVVQVADSRRALAHMSHCWYGFPTEGMTIIGVTGTNGKTTTTFILKSLLETRGEPIGLIGTTGNYIGNEVVPTAFTTPEAPELCALFARMRDAGICTVVMEVSSHGLALDRVAGVEFSGALFTNLTQDHLDFHASMDEYAQVKKSLFDGLSATAVAIANGDDPHGRVMLRDTAARLVLFGRATDNDIRIDNEHFLLASTEFTLAVGDNEHLRITIPLIGRFNVENAAACAAYCLATGWTARELGSALQTARGARGRMERIVLSNGAVAVVDYAHTPDALEKALYACRELVREKGRLLCVFGCGGDRDKTKRPLMGRVASALADSIIVTNDNPRRESPELIIEDILAGVVAESNTCVIPDRATAIRDALAQTHSGDVLLIAGKGHETYQLVGSVRHHFDDCEHVRHNMAVLWKEAKEQEEA